jgi:oligopeptidase B
MSTWIRRQGVWAVLSQALLASTLAVFVACTGVGVEASKAGHQAVPATPQAPLAARKPFMVLSPNGAREDDWYWLRDDTRQLPEMLDYLKAENSYAEAMMKPAAATEEQLYQEMIARIKPDDRSAPVFHNGYWYYTRYEAGAEYPIYARRKVSMEADEQVLIDGNAEAQGKGFFQVSGWAVSPDNQRLMYAVDDVGRRQYQLRVRDLKTGQLLSDRITNAEPDAIWADNQTLLYIEKDPVTLLSTRVRKHVLGQAVDNDPLVYEEQDHSFYMSLARSKSDKYLFINLKSTLVSETRYAAIKGGKLDFKPVIPRAPDHEYEVENVGRDFIIRTNDQAPNFRIVRARTFQAANKKNWTDVVPHRDDAFIESFDVFKDYLVLEERSEGLSKLRVQFWKNGKSELIGADEPSYVAALGDNWDYNVPTLRYVYTSLTTPRTTYDYDPRSHEKRMVKQEAVLGGFDQSQYVTEYLHATARDGTAVPVTLMYRKGFQKNGRAPLYQYAYGSYGYSTDPSFRSTWISLADRGFVLAIAHIRGGQEMGRRWYEDGKLLKKKNTFTDFVDVTQYLVDQHYVAADQVFAMGGSAGGLLMGAVANMAPEKYRGIIAHVPFVDVVTTMLDESIPLTTNEFDEWGNPKQKAYYDYMLSYSPYDNVAAKGYPAMYVTTGLWDSQVQYYEPAKWVAKLRASKTDSHPLIFRVNMEAGHGGKSGRYQRYRETAQEYSFVLQQLGMAH